jgi:hypothetical protein
VACGRQSWVRRGQVFCTCSLVSEAIDHWPVSFVSLGAGWAFTYYNAQVRQGTPLRPLALDMLRAGSQRGGSCDLPPVMQVQEQRKARIERVNQQVMNCLVLLNKQPPTSALFNSHAHAWTCSPSSLSHRCHHCQCLHTHSVVFPHTSQLRDFYGPLLACVTATKSAYIALIRQHR